MSVTVARAVVAGLRANRITVHESDGAYSRGNGLTSSYAGGVFHHTASAYGRDYPALYNGRPDLPGPLCNTSGNDDGSVTLIAAHPANHAGASGGWDTAPLPVTGLFNKLVWGHEIVYPGVVPMREEQYRTACVLARVLCNVLNVPMSHMKFHDGTSITGKWDPGFADGKTYDVAQFRVDAANMEGEDDVSAEEVWSHPIAAGAGLKRAADVLSGMDRDFRWAFNSQQQQITALTATVDALSGLLSGESPSSAAEIKAAVAEAIAEGVVTVDVSVRGQV